MSEREQLAELRALVVEFFEADEAVRHMGRTSLDRFDALLARLEAARNALHAAVAGRPT